VVAVAVGAVGVEARGGRLSTPRAIGLLTVAVLVPAIVLGIVIAALVSSLTGGFDQLSQRAAPQVRASADLDVALSDMDAQVANVLLVGDDAGLSDNRAHAMLAYGQGRTQADGDVQRVAAIGGDDPTVARLVTTLLDHFGQYQALAGEALSLNAAGHDPSGRPSTTELAVYRQATALVPTLLAETQSLVQAGQATLNRTYDSNRSTATLATVLVVVLGVLLLAALVTLQLYLRRRLRRRLNPAIAGATLVALAVTVVLPILLAGAGSHLRTATQDAFHPIVALSQARAVSQEAAANESRFLVDPARAAQYQQAFQNESQQVITLTGADIDHYDTTLRATLDAYDVDYSNVRFGGDFATEADHTGSLAERYTAIRAMARYAGYELADRAMRATYGQGDLRDAIEFDTGTALGYSSYDLNRYDQALGNLINVKQQVFDQAITAGTDDLAGWSGLLPAIAVLLIVALLGVGVWPRLAEYRS
jgi:hypothetical protein